MGIQTIEVKLSDELLKRLDERIRERGGDRSRYIQEVLEKDLCGTPHAGMTFAEILAPLQQDFEATGMTEEELGEFIEAEIKAYRAERGAKERQSSG